MLNRVCLIGRLTHDPDMKMTASGKDVCQFNIAVAKRIKPADGSTDADFFRVVTWGQQASYVSTYLGKGQLLCVEGRLQSRKYTTDEGVLREVIEVVADNVSGLSRPTDSTTKAPTQGGSSDEYDPFADA